MGVKQVKTCADIIDCSPQSWDLLFCVCTPVNQSDNVCSPPSMGNPAASDFPALTQIVGVGNNNNVPNLLGKYSTDWSASDQLPSTGFNTQAWAGTDAALADDGSYATISPGSATDPTPNHQGSQYIVLKGPGLNLPLDAIVLGIAVAVKGFAQGTQVVEGAGTTVSRGPIDIFNAALISNGVPYYGMDPRGTQGTGVDYTSADPYPVGSEFTQNRSLMGLNLSTIIDTSEDMLVAVGIAATQGFQPGSIADCIGDDDVAGIAAPMPNNFWIPTLKPLWSVAEINDQNFGVAISVSGFSNQGTVGPHTSHSTVVYNLNSVGIAVYYTSVSESAGGGGGGGTDAGPGGGGINGGGGGTGSLPVVSSGPGTGSMATVVPAPDGDDCTRPKHQVLYGVSGAGPYASAPLISADRRTGLQGDGSTGGVVSFLFAPPLAGNLTTVIVSGCEDPSFDGVYDQPTSAAWGGDGVNQLVQFKQDGPDSSSAGGELLSTLPSVRVVMQDVNRGDDNGIAIDSQYEPAFAKGGNLEVMRWTGIRAQAKGTGQVVITPASEDDSAQFSSMAIDLDPDKVRAFERGIRIADSKYMSMVISNGRKAGSRFALHVLNLYGVPFLAGEQQ